jgi:hypothetical protein
VARRVIGNAYLGISQAMPCDLTPDGPTSVSDVRQIVNEALGLVQVHRPEDYPADPTHSRPSKVTSY